MLEQDSFDELADHGWLVGVEFGGGFECQAQVLVGSAFAGGEDVSVGAYVERDG